MSIFASNKPVPKAETIADTVSTDTYDKEQSGVYPIIDAAS